MCYKTELIDKKVSKHGEMRTKKRIYEQLKRKQ